ncbi:MAG: UDP-N-acetylmuramoyl-L-alanyl-D-glutamate--2,6-diaminopimelate ligase, partial [Actinobacteria bacterium]|nr:UDP-N-acetylmuramoyl-L-alanyl-D-glutamate--2,6-diaminopimelate ligase [Actinomycetota bacterium]NIS29253.1 UDP-N-acetylmuramoyl-L-alanyl-D-glutamate--2,6-diaminopimelate ligase [Actinomycetota bacterium]NIT94415.1 UDP-N-acetylmuramoyl-L-alanyl-D-glutamate--2,6-diaminopimelate ligase [Actinomycetota bacterium]NIU18031.1 UDP-N-acetylmuramoyl-L-alanyl-D-glutamate--2,6-diaminopimelate ligase [Actinomycetota bacterium]NIU64645.1 UDP-N-acetylmuramoyl-L-alanyl-D-glutamate--2,6-diaminopimelate ligas
AEMTVVGVTGTNGKTTVTHLLESIGRAAGMKVGLIGTVGARIAGIPQPVSHTTPEATHLQRLFRSMADAGVDLVAMEVSSHALAYGRADAIDFDVAAFTNLSQDHLDFHGDMEEYFAAKRRLFESNRARRAVVNVDDPAGVRLAAEVSIPVTTVGFSLEAGIRARVLGADPRGTTMEIVTPDRAFTVTTRIAGQFNAANALVAAACALEVGIAPEAIAAGLLGSSSVPGRFEPVEAGQEFAVIVDYAHTPEAIRNVIDAVRPLTAGKVIAVGGAGGDRDRGKRPLMGAALAEADLAIVTSDNPRSEDPAAIAAAVVSGAPPERAVVTELDRRTAIRKAVAAAAAGDVVLILGKGHETGQQFATASVPFDDRVVAGEEINARAARPPAAPLSWSPAEVAAATGGRPFGDSSVRITRVVTDSREAGPGALFVAMRGKTQDGHGYAGDALRAGAAAVLVEPGVAAEPRIEVANTAVALRDLAVARRDQFSVPVIAVTGSTGKTSTKDLLAAALPNAAASPKSYNNEV